MRVRVYRVVATGEVVIDCPVARYQSTVETLKHPWRFREDNPDFSPFTMEIRESEDLTAMCAGTNESGSAQFYYDGETLKHDNDRSELLMHVNEIKAKHRKRLTRKLDEELSKETPDPVTVIRLQRDREKVKDWTDEQTYAQAVANLDEDGLAKPKIRAKLSAKMSRGK